MRQEFNPLLPALPLRFWAAAPKGTMSYGPRGFRKSLRVSGSLKRPKRRFSECPEGLGRTRRSLQRARWKDRRMEITGYHPLRDYWPASKHTKNSSHSRERASLTTTGAGSAFPHSSFNQSGRVSFPQTPPPFPSRSPSSLFIPVPLLIIG